MKKKIRKWILIEDDQEKARILIGYILQLFSSEEVWWLWPVKKVPFNPFFISSRELNGDAIYTVDDFVCPKDCNKQISGRIKFIPCTTRPEFFQSLRGATSEKVIFLVDVELPTLGSTSELDAELAEYLKNYLLSEKSYQGIVTIITGRAHPAATKQVIKEGDSRILTSGEWAFQNNKVNDCHEVIIQSDAQWKKHFEKNHFTLQDFFENMAQFDQHETHNWENDTPSKLDYYIEKKRWNTEWNMPIQLGFLIKLLNYDPQEFVETFELKNEHGFFANGSSICECLKIMGTKAKDNQEGSSEGSRSFSLLAVLFFAWAAYRQTFATEEDRADEKFIEAIKGIGYNNQIARYSMITPPQSNASLRKTGQALFNMMTHVFKSTRPQDRGEDLLRRLKLNKDGLAFHLDIYPDGLFHKMQLEYGKRYLNHKNQGGGDTSRKIFDYIDRANYCDAPQRDREPFWGPPFSLNIHAAGDENENGIILRFGRSIA